MLPPNAQMDLFHLQISGYRGPVGHLGHKLD